MEQLRERFTRDKRTIHAVGRWARRWALVALGLTLGLASSRAVARERHDPGGNARAKFCTQTSNALARACTAASSDDYWVAYAKCLNISDAGARDTCFRGAQDERKGSKDDCKSQLEWRLASCDKTGEARYDPVIDPATFESDYRHLANANPYFPLTIGNHWEYQGGGELNTVDINGHTKLIAGVTCLVANDRVFVSGNLSESTNDWLCQAKDGDVWYFGEETGEYETFSGDVPQLPELVNIDGSFKADRNGDKAGIIFLAHPVNGQVYFEEAALGEAEDATEIISTTYSYGADPNLDRNVPRALAELLCENDCVVTKNYSLLEPDVIDHKYYARGIGVFLEVDGETGEASQLTSCNFDSRCSHLPSP